MPKKGRAKHMRGSCSLKFYFSLIISYLHRFFELRSHIFALCKWKRVTQHAKVLTLSNCVQYPSISTHQAHIQLISPWKTGSHTNIYSLGSEEDCFIHLEASNTSLPYKSDASAVCISVEPGPMQRTSHVRSLQKFSPHPRGAHRTGWHSHSLLRPDGSLQQSVVKLPLSGTAQCIVCLTLSLNGSLTPLFLIVFDYPRTSHSLPHTEFPRGSHPFHT